MGRRAQRPAPKPTLVRAAAATLAANPTATTGSLVMTAMAVAILTNALTLQPGRHPAPLFLGTRPVAEADQPPTGSLGDPADALDDLVSRAGGKPARAQPLVADVQLELKTRGFYAGEVDGLPGPMTAAAVVAYQKSVGIEPTGAISAGLLERLQGGDGPRSAAEPPPPPEPVAETDVAAAAGIPIPTPRPRPSAAPAAPAGTVAAAPRPVPAQPVRVEPVRIDPEAVPAAEAAVDRVEPPPARPAAASAPAVRPDPRIAKIQEALDLLGYGPLKADGVMSPATRASIRRFEENRGLAVTGEINKPFLQELIAIGGLSG